MLLLLRLLMLTLVLPLLMLSLLVLPLLMLVLVLAPGVDACPVFVYHDPLCAACLEAAELRR